MDDDHWSCFVVGEDDGICVKDLARHSYTHCRLM